MKPILFSTEMVQALLVEKKTETRRIVKKRDKSPYGQIGDALWVRETWTKVDNLILFKADFPTNGIKWKPNIFMPQEYCRLYLEITDLGIERLLEIDEEGARAEGFESRNDFLEYFKLLGGNKEQDNPFVWVVKFKVI